MKINKQIHINYLNEALLLSSYIFNNDVAKDEILCLNMDDLNISKEDIEEKYSQLKLFFLKTRTEVRKISQNYSELSDVFMIDPNNNYPSIIYFIMYRSLSESIKSYTIEEFHTIYKDELEDNLKSLGDITATKDYVNLIDSIKTFNNTQKFSLLKLLHNINSYFDKLYYFVAQVENIIIENIHIIEDLIQTISSSINIEYVKTLQEFSIIEQIMENCSIDEITISLRINLFEKITFSLLGNKILCGEIYCGLVPYLLKDNYKNYNDEKNEIFNLLTIIADETRFNILHLLNNKKMYGREIANALDLSTGTVSHHLTKLISVNIVNSAIEGNKIYYSLNKSIINYLSNYFGNILGDKNE